MTRAVQTELLPSGHVDLFSRPQPTTTEPSFPIAETNADDETLESVIAFLREANSNFLGTDMRRVIMAAIPRREKVAIRDVVRRCIDALGVEGTGHANRIGGLIDRMVGERVLVSSMTQVWRKPE